MYVCVSVRVSTYTEREGMGGTSYPWLHTSCVFKCLEIRNHDFQFPDSASVPFNLRLLKQKGKKKTYQHTAQNNKPNCKVESTSPQDRNKQVPQESQKTYEYKKLISSDHFLRPPRQIRVSIYYFTRAMHEEYEHSVMFNIFGT